MAPISLQPLLRGGHSAYAKAQLQIVDFAKPFIIKAVDAHSASLNKSTCSLTIADFGTVDAAASSAAVSLAIQHLRDCYGFEASKAITAVHDSWPHNSWNELFDYLYNDQDSYLKANKGVQALASGNSFYEQVVAENSLHLGISCASLQWCSVVAEKISQHCFSMFGTQNERDAFQKQAALDWENFLKARSVELVRGGVLICHVISTDETVPFMFDAVYEAAQALNADLTNTDKELLDFNVPLVWRSPDDVLDHSLFARLGLEVVVAEQCMPDDNVLYQDYQQHNDVDSFIEDFASLMRREVETAFKAALSPTRSTDEKHAAFRMLWDEYKKVLKTAPGECANTWHNFFIVLKKI